MSDVTFSVSNFRAKVGSIVRPNIFSVKFSSLSPVLVLMGYNTNDLKDIEFRCERAEIPGKTVATVDDISVGPSMKLPYDVTYNDIQLTFICSEDMLERRFFESWMDEIVALPTSDSKGGLIRYYDDFALNTNMIVIQANSAGEKVLEYELYHAFPIALSPMTLAWEETNTYQRFTVTMSYRYHAMTYPFPNYE